MTLNMVSKYFAFISYNHKDAKVAKWLHGNLESFKLPSEIHNDIEANNKYLRPVFRDKDELNAGILGNELRTKLEESKYLIVICSSNSAKSEWVSNEVKAFIEMGRLDRIIPLMLEEGDRFPRALKEYTAEHPEMELLGVSIPEVGKEKALVRIISKMLGVEFDSLWNRHKRQKKQRIIIGGFVAAIVLAALGLVWRTNQPIDITVDIQEGGYINSNLPAIKDVIMSIDLGDEVKTDTLHSLPGELVIKNVPAKSIGKEGTIRLEANHCTPKDTTVILQKNLSAYISRDASVYGHISAKLYNFEKEKPLAGRTITIAGISLVTNVEGCFTVEIPIDKQMVNYSISSTDTKLLDNVIYMPCQEEAFINAELEIAI